MSTPNGRSPGVLCLVADPAPMLALLEHLRQLGMAVDTTADLNDARRVFFGNGGHDCLVVAPDVRPGLAVRVAASLRTVDPELAAATFGPDLRRLHPPTRTAMLAGFHPGSRAGQGALLRFLRLIRLR